MSLTRITSTLKKVTLNVQTLSAIPRCTSITLSIFTCVSVYVVRSDWLAAETAFTQTAGVNVLKCVSTWFMGELFTCLHVVQRQICTLSTFLGVNMCLWVT